MRRVKTETLVLGGIATVALLWFVFGGEKDKTPLSTEQDRALRLKEKYGYLR